MAEIRAPSDGVHVKRDLTGERYGRLTVVRRGLDRIYSNGVHMPTWVCLCLCGNVKEIPQSSLVHGYSQSCGCLQSETTASRNTSHGHSRERLYRVWHGIKQRCENPHSKVYQHYGGKGIRVCKEWQDNYMAFREWALANGYDETAERGKCTVDRIDVDGDYCPTNCRIVAQAQQTRNTTRNKWITIGGITQLEVDWANELGIKLATLCQRARRSGMSAQTILEQLYKEKMGENYGT